MCSAAVGLRRESGFQLNRRFRLDFPLSRLLYYLISIYQRAISPYMGVRCRYIPSCSEYMKEAVESKGFLRGSFIGFKRILRCAPWGGGGLDLYEKES